MYRFTVLMSIFFLFTVGSMEQVVANAGTLWRGRICERETICKRDCPHWALHWDITCNRKNVFTAVFVDFCWSLKQTI